MIDPKRNARGDGNRHRVNENMHLNIRIDKEEYSMPAGISVAAALILSGRKAFRTPETGSERGLFCGMGVCYECLVEIDGTRDQRACLTPITEGMSVLTGKAPR